MPPKEDSISGHLLDHRLRQDEQDPSPEDDRNNATDSMVNKGNNHSHLQQLSDTAMQKSGATLGDQELWWIHGNGYDLQSFVERHPGGLEAILLGKGRDCTALVESYHAFSSHHSKILEKYLVKTMNTKPTVDHFYDVLKQRVADALKAQGIDPVEDRGAGWWRSIYYVLIVAMVFITGYYHVKVRYYGSLACRTIQRL